MWTQWKSSVCPAASTPSNTSAVYKLMPLFFFSSCADGAIKVDPSGLNGRKGTWIPNLLAPRNSQEPSRMSPSLQSTSTWPAPSATEATTWTWWGCPSGGTSGSSASRCTHPRGTPRPTRRCRNSSWRRSESRDIRFPSRSEGVAHLWFHVCFQLKCWTLWPQLHLFCLIYFRCPQICPAPSPSSQGPTILARYLYPPYLCSPLSAGLFHSGFSSTSGLRRGLWGQSVPRQRPPQHRRGHREEVREL